jgi:hypothetical protein
MAEAFFDGPGVINCSGLRMIERRKMAPAESVGPLRVESDELCRIISAGRKTAEENMRKETRR